MTKKTDSSIPAGD